MKGIIFDCSVQFMKLLNALVITNHVFLFRDGQGLPDL